MVAAEHQGTPRFTELRDQVVILSGGGSGIGQALLLDLLENDARVASLDVNNEATERLVRDRKRGENALLLTVDVADSAACRAAVDRVHTAWGRIDALLNVAGIAPRAEIQDLTDEIWDRVIRTNLYGTFFLTREVLRYMIPRKRGRILNFSSGVAKMGRVGQVAYAASKGGVAALSKSLAHELQKHGITVNTIFPAADTPLMRREEPPQIVEMLHQMGLPEPSRLTSGILFWLSDAAKEWTGNEMEWFMSMQV